MITYSSENVRFPNIKRRETTAWIRRVAATYGKKVGEVGYLFCDDGDAVFAFLFSSSQPSQIVTDTLQFDPASAVIAADTDSDFVLVQQH